MADRKRLELVNGLILLMKSVMTSFQASAITRPNAVIIAVEAWPLNSDFRNRALFFADPNSC